MDSFTGKLKYEKISMLTMVTSRLDVIFFSMFEVGKGFLNKFNAIALILVLFFIYKFQKKQKTIHNHFALFAYFFIGFFVLSFLHNGYLLYYYFSPFIPLCLIFFCGIVFQYKSKFLYLLVIMLVFSNVYHTSLQMIGDLKNINNSFSSWKFLNSVVNRLTTECPGECGVFIYTPDVLAYQAKYALLYGKNSQNKKKLIINEKRNITFVIEEPPPSDRPELKGDWWIINRIKITSKPIKIYPFKYNYLLKKFYLSNEDTKVPFDPLIADWITMR